MLKTACGAGAGGEAWLMREVLKRVHQKLGDPAGSPKHILTGARVGYRMVSGVGD